MEKSEIKQRLESAMHRFQEASRQGGSLISRYGFEVEPLSEDGAEFDLTFTFLADETYCCLEYGCHFGFHGPESWAEFRKVLVSEGWQPGRAMRICHVSVHTEGGAMDRCTGDEDTYPFFGVPSCNQEAPETEKWPAEAAVKEEGPLSIDWEWAEAGVVEEPGDFRAWLQLAQIRRDRAGWAEALEPMKRAVELAPDNLFLRGSFVLDLALAERHAEVASECAEILRRFPGLVWAEKLMKAARER